jgi:hypothetical protein
MDMLPRLSPGAFQSVLTVRDALAHRRALSLAKATQDGEPAAMRDAHAIVSPFARHPIVHHRGASSSTATVQKEAMAI